MNLRVVLLLIPLFFSVRAADIGSDTAVNRFNTQQTFANGDRVAGFAALAAGFSVAANATATFDSFFPVSGNIELNFATLSLNQDLITRDETDIMVLGNINGNGHIFELAPDAVCWASDDSWIGGTVCTITMTFEVVESSAIDSIRFSFDSLYIAEGVGTNLLVDEVINENFLENKASAAIGKNVNSVDWHPSKDFIAFATSSGGGDELFTYAFDRVGETLTLIDSINIGSGGTSSVNGVAWHPDGDHLAVAADSNNNELRVYVVNSDGTFGASTTVDLGKNDATTVDWDVDGSFLVVGTDVKAGWDELRVYSFVKSPLGLSLDASIDIGVAVNSVRWNKSGTANGEIVIGTASATDGLRVFRHDGAGSIAEVTTGVTVAVACNAVDWHPGGGCIVAGFDSNAGYELRSYSFESDALTQITAIEETDNVNTVAWSPNGSMLIVGTEGLDTADPRVQLYEVTTFGGGVVTFDSLNLVFDGNVTFNQPAIKFTGENSINGLTNMLSFAPTFSIEVQSNSSLFFKDVILEGINTGKITLVDTTSTISFQNVTIVLDDDYIFDTGHFEILKDLTICGDGHSFIYQSTEPSMIRARAPQLIADGICQPGFCGSLILDKGVTFSYDSTISSTLLVLEGASSKIVMNSAILAETAGLQLTKGKLLIDGKSSFVTTQGITLGDGTVANNACLAMWPAGNLELGTLIKQNIDA